jgi:hypothetical protein
MPMVEKHIKSLLYDHDCVIIPDFGGLITRYVSARINPVKQSLVPPSKKIAFNEKLVLNDGLLISTIAYNNRISKEEAKRLVSDFVLKAKSTLHVEKRFVLQDIGVFKYSSEQRLEFDYVESDNLLDASFGLPDLVARPIRIEEPAVLRTLLKERQQAPVTIKQPFRKRLKRAYNVAAGLALTGLSVSALYFLSLQTDYDLSSLNPIMLFNAGFKANSNAIDKYTSDYVPFTEDERIAVYEVLLPAAPKQEEIIEEEVLEELEVVETETLTDTPEATDNKVNAVTDSKPEVIAEPVKPVTTINNKTERFYIITGGYSTLGNAEISRNAIRKEGHESKVLVPGPGSKLYRVSAADFETEQEARAAMSEYKKSFGETIWVFKY